MDNPQPWFAAPLLDALASTTDPTEAARLRRLLALAIPPEAIPEAPQPSQAPATRQPDTPATTPEWVEMLKKGQYQQALQLLEAHDLANPEKSVYFADQIRFLRKLIYNASKI